MAKAKSKQPQRECEIFQRNRRLLQDYWLQGKRAIPTAIPKDAGIRKFIAMVEYNDPTSCKELVRQCCGNVPQAVDLSVQGGDPGQPIHYVATYAGGLPGAPGAVALPAGARG